MKGIAEVNLFTIMKDFWDEAPYLEGYKGDHASLFFAILDSVHRNFWREVEIEYDRLISKVRLGKKNYLECRRWLVENRFIVLKEGRGDYAKAKFFLGSAVLHDTAFETAKGTAPRTAKRSNAVSNEVLDRTADETGPETANETHLNKTIRHKDNKTLLPTSQPENGVPKVSGFSKKEVEEKPPVAAHPQKIKWREGGQYLLSDEDSQRIGMREVKNCNLQSLFPTYASLIDEFVEQKIYEDGKEESPYDSMNEFRKRYRNWLPKYLPLRRDQEKNHEQGSRNSKAAGFGPRQTNPAAGQSDPNRKIRPRVNIGASFGGEGVPDRDETENSVEDATWRPVG